MRKKRFFLIASIITVFIAVTLIAESWLNSYLAGKIQHIKTGNFQLDAEKIHVRLFSRKVMAEDLLLNNKKTNEKIAAEKINIEGIHLIPILLKKKYIVENVTISKIDIHISASSTNSNGGMKNMLVRVKNITVSDSDILIFNQLEHQKDSVFYGRFNFEGKDLSLPKSWEKINDKKDVFVRVQFSVNHATWFLPGKLNKLNLNNLNFDSKAPTLKLDSARLFTIYSKHELARKTGVETDWYNLFFTGFEIQNLNLNSLLKQSAFVVGQVQIKKFNGEIFRDKRLPFPKKPDTKLPAEMVKKLPFPFHCDSFKILNAHLTYSERLDNAFDDSRVTFNKMQASISDLSNVDSLITGPTVIKASAKVMNKTLLTARFDIPNKKYADGYKVEGTLEATDITAFNPVIIPNARAHVESGSLKTFVFNFNYNNNRSTGNLIFEYDNLDIAFLNPEDDSEKKLKSLFANTFVVKKENLKGADSYTEGTISFERDKKKSIFNYWWKSILSGIKSISIA